MDLLQIKILNGPNYWSNHWKQLIVLQIDLKEYEELPTNLLENFPQGLQTLLPSLKSHYCSRNKEGGFLERVNEGTWLGHVIEHVALELQCLAGMSCGFGRTRSTNIKGIYNVVFFYEVAEAGIYAGKAALRLVKALAQNKPYENLDRDIAKLKHIFHTKGFGISTKSIIDEAQKRNIPITVLHKHPLVMLGYGRQQKLISATITSDTSCIGVDFSSNKTFTKEILANACIPVPKGAILSSLKHVDRIIEDLGFPLVIKPCDGNHGRGITTNIQNKEQLIAAYKQAKQISSGVIAEKYIPGFDFRFLVINYKLVAVAKRIPARIVGDGRSTIKDLITSINQDPKRGNDHENILTTIKIDEVTRSILRENNLTIDSILPLNKTLYLKHAANLSSGGTAVNVTHLVHPKNAELAERIARFMHLDICGIDIIAHNVEQPITNNHGAVIEVNAAPGFRMHLSPSEGSSINIGKYIIDMLFPQNIPCRIPIIAVTGTNGKTSTVQLIAHLAQQAGKSVGFTTTEGIYLNDEVLFYGDCSGPQSAKAILSDTKIDFAVLECARGGIIRSGLGFDHCDIGILMNISEDHLGLNGIETIEELARVKSVVPRSVKSGGYAILNADDALVYEIKNDLKCHIALFSSQTNAKILDHCNAGGIGAYIENKHIIIHQNKIKTPMVKLTEIPLTNGGKARCMVENILASILAGLLSGFTMLDISKWLKAFNVKKIPGRMNIFDLGKYKVMVDYAHNVGAFQELENYLSHIHCSKKIGIIGTPGDRRPEDISNIGFYAARIFDEIIIRHDKDGRGRTNEEITALLQQGMVKHTSKRSVSIISDEQEALLTVLNSAPVDSFIVYCPEKIFEAIAFLTELENSSQTHTVIL